MPSNKSCVPNKTQHSLQWMSKFRFPVLTYTMPSRQNIIGHEKKQDNVTHNQKKKPAKEIGSGIKDMLELAGKD